MGLNYTEASGQLWRSNILVDIGRPIVVTDELLQMFQSGEKGATKAARALTDTLEEYIRYVAVSSPNWKDELLLYCDRKGLPPPRYYLQMLIDGSWSRPTLRQAMALDKTSIRAVAELDGTAETSASLFFSEPQVETTRQARKRQSTAEGGVEPVIPTDLHQEVSRAAFFGYTHAVGFNVFGKDDDRFITLINMARRLYKPKSVQFALAEYSRLTRNFTAGFLRTDALVDPDFQRIWEDVDAYERELKLIGISDTYVRQSSAGPDGVALARLRRSTGRNLAKEAVMAPLAALGTLTHLPVMGVAWYAGTRFGVEKDGDASVVATMKIIAGFVTLCTYYPLVGFGAYEVTGALTAIPIAISAMALSG